MDSEFSAGVLNLRASTREACVLDPLLQRVLQAIARTASGAQSPEILAALRRFEQLRAILKDRHDRQTALDVADEVVALCTTLLEAAAPLKSAAKELAAALTMIRDAITSLSTDEEALGRSLSDTAGRFEALRHMPDLHTLRLGLAREVAAFRELAAAREAQWRRRVQHVEGKLSVLEDQLKETQVAAMHDSVTGLVNRRTVEKAFATLVASRQPFVLALLDLDDFKDVNDTLGHLAGDAALKAVADSLRAAFRSKDIVGRFGGDEFVVLMEDATLAQAERRCQTVIRDLQKVSFSGEQSRPIGMTGGLAEFSAGDTFAGLAKRADQALYDAKRAGKNRVVSRRAPFIRDLKRR